MRPAQVEKTPPKVEPLRERKGEINLITPELAAQRKGETGTRMDVDKEGDTSMRDRDRRKPVIVSPTPAQAPSLTTPPVSMPFPSFPPPSHISFGKQPAAARVEPALPLPQTTTPMVPQGALPRPLVALQPKKKGVDKEGDIR